MSNANPNSNPTSNFTSNQDRLNLYIHQLHQRLRLGVSLRGVAILTATALITTVFLVLILNRFAFPVRGLTGARTLLLIVIACAAGLALALPLMRLTRRRATVVAGDLECQPHSASMSFAIGSRFDSRRSGFTPINASLPFAKRMR